jgi:hypothetical protein
MEGEQVYVDWRGNAADERRHGGVRATVFLYGKPMLPLLLLSLLLVLFHALRAQ